jgi:sensor histidine kinase YesM
MSDTRPTRMMLAVLLAWLPFTLLWALIILTYEGARPLVAFRHGAVAIGVAAALGFAVWGLTRRCLWPHRLGPRFYLVHIAAGVGFATLWTSVGMALNSLIAGRPFLSWPFSLQLTFWRFLMGLFLYGLIAGISYSLRIREQLRRQERMTKAAQALASEAKHASLRTRLNPHFLFNALHSVAELVHNDPAAADRALDRLGTLLRCTLDEDAGDMVVLADEWAFVEGYLEIERLRLGPRLQVSSDLDPASLSCSLPSFTLQVLVENAVRHAVAPRPEGGRIHVGARAVDRRLHLEVIDDGPGLRWPLDAESAGDEEGPSRRGLALLRERLEVSYGARAALRLEAAPGGGTAARISLPAAAARPVRS